MRKMKNDCIILEDVICRSECSEKRMFCPRGIFPYWREIWLRRATGEPPAPGGRTLRNGPWESGSRPRVSFGLPVYNEERSIRRCLDSILAQDFSDFEVVVSDNASTDRTPEILAATPRATTGFESFETRRTWG